MPLRLLAVLVTVLGSLAATPAQAQLAGTDTHLWGQAVATLRLPNQWRLHLEEQPRWFNDISEPFQVLTRTAAGRQMNARLTLWAGHAWIAKPPGPGVTHEQRLWQQASITLPLAGRWATSLRLRQEQRWQANWADSSHRTRLMVRAQRPVGTARWALVGWNEVMVNLDDTPKGPPQGFDQNRLFGGLNRRLSKQATVDAGYLWVEQKLPSGRRAHMHVPFVSLGLAF